MLEPAGDLDAERRQGGELYRIAHHIAPQAAVSTDDDRVVLIELHFFEGERARVLFAVLIHRHELIEDAVIEKQQHPFFIFPVLRGKEAFRCIVGFPVIHIGRRNELLELAAVGGKVDPAMYVQFQVGPNIQQVIGAGDLEYALDEHDGPRGHTGYIGYVLFDGAVRHALYLLFPLGHEGDRKLRQAEELAGKGHVLQHDGGEVAKERSSVELVHLVTAAQQQAFA